MAFAEDYVDVAERIREFRDKHPDGSLRPLNVDKPFEIVTTPDGIAWVVVVAAAYRTPDDAAPGVGMAWETYPGKTNFTKGSELQNAETSAWGRAIVAVGAADTKRGVASSEDVRNRRAEQQQPAPRQAMSAADYQAACDAVATSTDVEALKALWAEAQHRADGWAMDSIAARGKELTEANA